MGPAAAAGSRAVERALPSGTIAFLFTDIVGSTVRWERDPEAMRRDVGRHDALMRSAIESNNGCVFKTVGDAFCAAFPTVVDGVCAALDAQRTLASESFASDGGVTVRMALHYGSAEERDADYFGPTLNRVARLLAIGHGEQVLLSSAAVEAAGELVRLNATLRDLGNHRLKDLTAPEHVYQLVAPGLRDEFPPLHSLSVMHNNLPQQSTSFVGREAEVAEMKSLIAQSRLVTLCGAGGVGKTRCALQVAADMLDDYQDGVWFADLAPLTDASLVAGTVGRIFDLQDSPNNTALESLTAHLKTKHALLILDNCEHVIQPVAQLVSAVIKGCPQVRIIATSREALNVTGETCHRMPSLTVPPRGPRLPAQTALQYGAVALFEQRARSVNARFSITDENAATIADICRHLDGIPLAIELAAARLRILTPAQLSQKLGERFRLLTGGDRSALPRQQTMRALIDWSYDLLTAREQTVFRELSVFSGSFNIDAASAVCCNDEIDEIDVIDIVASLVDKSLVFSEPGEDTIRYRLLESTREYADEKLRESGEHDRVANRHACSYADFSERIDAEYETVAPGVWLAQGEADLDNVRAALTWSFSPQGDAGVGQRIAATLPRIFGVLAPAEGLRWVQTALERVTPETPQIMVAGLELAHASFASIFNKFSAALAAGQRAIHAFILLQMPDRIADAQRLTGRSMMYLGHVCEGEELLKESLARRQASGSRRIGGILGDLAVARALQGDISGARALFAQASLMFEEGADTSKLAITAATLAEAEFLAGDADAALRLAEEALTSARGVGRHRTAAAILSNMAAYHLHLEHYEDAKHHAREALEICRDLQTDVVSVIFALQHLAAAAVLRTPSDGARAAVNHRRAANLLGYVEGRLAALEIPREQTEQRGYDKLVESLRTAFTPEELEPLLESGRAWTEEHALAEASVI